MAWPPASCQTRLNPITTQLVRVIITKPELLHTRGGLRKGALLGLSWCSLGVRAINKWLPSSWMYVSSRSPNICGGGAVMQHLGWGQSCNIWGGGSHATSGVGAVMQHMGWGQSCNVWGGGSHATENNTYPSTHAGSIFIRSTLWPLFVPCSHRSPSFPEIYIIGP